MGLFNHHKNHKPEEIFYYSRTVNVDGEDYIINIDSDMSLCEQTQKSVYEDCISCIKDKFSPADIQIIQIDLQLEGVFEPVNVSVKGRVLTVTIGNVKR